MSYLWSSRQLNENNDSQEGCSIIVSILRVRPKIFFLILALLTGGCDDFVSREEMFRLSSPDKMVDVVLVRTNGGVTTPFGYMLYIVPVGNEPEEGLEICRSRYIGDLTVYWKKIKYLEIFYTEGEILEFANYWNSETIQNGHYTVEIRLTPYGEFSLPDR